MNRKEQWVEGRFIKPVGKEVVLTHVLQDLVHRAEERYREDGKFIMTHDGEDSMQNAYETALDLCMYFKKGLLEREGTVVEGVFKEGLTNEE